MAQVRPSSWKRKNGKLQKKMTWPTFSFWLPIECRILRPVHGCGLCAALRGPSRKGTAESVKAKKCTKEARDLPATPHTLTLTHCSRHSLVTTCFFLLSSSGAKGRKPAGSLQETGTGRAKSKQF